MSKNWERSGRVGAQDLICFFTVIGTDFPNVLISCKWAGLSSSTGETGDEGSFDVGRFSGPEGFFPLK